MKFNVKIFQIKITCVHCNFGILPLTYKAIQRISHKRNTYDKKRLYKNSGPRGGGWACHAEILVRRGKGFGQDKNSNRRLRRARNGRAQKHDLRRQEHRDRRRGRPLFGKDRRVRRKRQKIRQRRGAQSGRNLESIARHLLYRPRRDRQGIADRRRRRRPRHPSGIPHFSHRKGAQRQQARVRRKADMHRLRAAQKNLRRAYSARRQEGPECALRNTNALPDRHQGGR